MLHYCFATAMFMSFGQKLFVRQTFSPQKCYSVSSLQLWTRQFVKILLANRHFADKMLHCFFDTIMHSSFGQKSFGQQTFAKQCYNVSSIQLCASHLVENHLSNRHFSDQIFVETAVALSFSRQDIFHPVCVDEMSIGQVPFDQKVRTLFEIFQDRESTKRF